jgi:hypothetical protein
VMIILRWFWRKCGVDWIYQPYDCVQQLATVTL